MFAMLLAAEENTFVISLVSGIFGVILGVILLVLIILKRNKHD